MAAACLVKVGTEPCLPLCRISSSFKKHAVNLRSPAAVRLGEECVPIFVLSRILVAQHSCVFFCRKFCIMMQQIFATFKDYRQVGLAPVFLYYEAMLL